MWIWNYQQIYDGSGASELVNFVEKPDFKHAENMLEAGIFWNIGIFLFAQDMINAFHAHAPEMLELVMQAVNDASLDLGFLRLAEEPWRVLKNISIIAIMEKAQNLVALQGKMV